MRLFTTTCAVAILAIVSAVPASAGIIQSFDFDSAGDTEGWAPGPNASNISGLTADGDSLNGTAVNNDPQLLNDSVNLSVGAGETWDTIVFRVREIQDESPAGPVDGFNPVGVIVALNTGTNFTSGFVGVDSGDDFFTVTLDISSFGTTPITSIRIDPIGGASGNSNSQTQGNTFEVDFIQVNDTSVIIPEPASIALIGLALVGVCRRRRVA